MTLDPALVEALVEDYENAPLSETDRAMLDYLDGARSREGAVNENYGRELMELFTLGPRDEDGFENYGQGDVRNLARSLTGFTFDAARKPVVYVSPDRFDDARKLLFIGRPFLRNGNLGVEGADGAPFPPDTNVLEALFWRRRGNQLGR